MPRMTRHAAAAAAIAAFTSLAMAGGHGNAPQEIKARNGMMAMISLNMGVVGNMARGRADYDADAAQQAADNLAAIAAIPQGFLWPDGTSTDQHEGTRALPKIWEDRAGFDAAWDGFVTATAALKENAGGGLDSLQTAMADIGKSCGACHDTYRQPR